MSMPFYVPPEQVMKDRADFARKGIARGRSVIVLGYDRGIAFVAENPSRALHKVSEIYDRIAFAAVGRYNEFESLRVAGIRYADLRGYSYDRTDVTARALANTYAQTLGAVFTQESKPFEIEIVVAEVGVDADTRPDLPADLRRVGRRRAGLRGDGRRERRGRGAARHRLATGHDPGRGPAARRRRARRRRERRAPRPGRRPSSRWPCSTATVRDARSGASSVRCSPGCSVSHARRPTRRPACWARRATPAPRGARARRGGAGPKVGPRSTARRPEICTRPPRRGAPSDVEAAHPTVGGLRRATGRAVLAVGAASSAARRADLVAGCQGAASSALRLSAVVGSSARPRPWPRPRPRTRRASDACGAACEPQRPAAAGLLRRTSRTVGRGRQAASAACASVGRRTWAGLSTAPGVHQGPATERGEHLADVAELRGDAVALSRGGRELAVGLLTHPRGVVAGLGDDLVGLRLGVLEQRARPWRASPARRARPAR